MTESMASLHFFPSMFEYLKEVLRFLSRQEDADFHSMLGLNRIHTFSRESILHYGLLLHDHIGQVNEKESVTALHICIGHLSLADLSCILVASLQGLRPIASCMGTTGC